MTKREFIEVIRAYNNARLQMLSNFVQAEPQGALVELPSPTPASVENFRQKHGAFLMAGKKYFQVGDSDRLAMHSTNVDGLIAMNNELFFSKMEAVYTLKRQGDQHPPAVLEAQAGRDYIQAAYQLNSSMMAFYETTERDYPARKLLFKNALQNYNIQLNAFVQTLKTLDNTQAPAGGVRTTALNNYIKLLHFFYEGVNKELRIALQFSRTKMDETASQATHRVFKEHHPIFSRVVDVVYSASLWISENLFEGVEEQPFVQGNEPSSETDLFDGDVLRELPRKFPDINPYWGLALESDSRAGSPSNDQEMHEFYAFRVRMRLGQH